MTWSGAWLSASGWPDVKDVFDRLATTSAKSLSQDLEVVAAGASSDLGYVMARELTSARMTDGTKRSYALRVTTVFRREAGAWKVVHRHGVPVVGL